jgi:hypothetical protein
MYVTQTEILAEIPAATLLQALDDDGDGVADANVWDEIATSASMEVYARLSPAVDLPDPTLETLGDDVPYAARAACRVFALEKIFQRRGMGDKNPWTEQANMWRRKLDRIGLGAEPLSAATRPAPDIPAPTRNFERTDQDGI